MVPQPEIESNEVVEVWDIHEAAVRAFLACGTQWRTVALTTWSSARVLRTGLDYSSVDTVMRRLRIKDPRGRVFGQVRLLESFALQAMAELG